MAKLYSKRLLASAGATDALSATVPAGVIWIVRDAILTFDGAVTSDAYQLGIVGVAPILYGQVAGGSVARIVYQGRQVLDAGEQLFFGASTLNWYVLVSGYELTTP